jgi:CDP-glucose 4,6-dehydratase
LEDLVNQLKGTYAGKRVLVTGHNGFKGSWLVALLNHLGAEVHGISLEILEDSPFKFFHSQSKHFNYVQDIRDFNSLEKLVKEINPDVVFHLAAQALVLDSYTNPRETFEVNVLGTANLLDSLDSIPCHGVVVVTTDKVYKNDNSGKSFREDDELWGHDPYSLSKTGTELVVSAWKNLSRASTKRIVSVRAGNVIGPGDRSGNRLLPDLIRAIKNKSTVVIRNPESIRPWQYVMDPLIGYLILGSRILEGRDTAPAYNFGPQDSSIVTVNEIVEMILRMENFSVETIIDHSNRESRLLILNSELAKNDLSWESTTNLHDSISFTLLLDDSVMTESQIMSHIEQYLANL